MIGQFGGGIDVRIARKIGWFNDFSWNIVRGAEEQIRMVRTGINSAFLRSTIAFAQRHSVEPRCRCLFVEGRPGDNAEPNRVHFLKFSC